MPAKVIYRNDLTGWFCAACFKQNKRPKMYYVEEIDNLDSILKEDEILILFGTGIDPLPYLDRLLLLFWFDDPAIIGNTKLSDTDHIIKKVSYENMPEAAYKTCFPNSKIPEHIYFLNKEHPFKYAAMWYFNDPRNTMSEWRRLIHYTKKDKEFFDNLTTKGKIIQGYEKKRHLHYG